MTTTTGTDALCELHPPYLVGGYQSQLSDPIGVSSEVLERLERAKTKSKSLHWLRGSVHRRKLEKLLHVLCSIWSGESPERREWGLWSYDRSFWWSIGITLCFHSSDERYAITKDQVTVEITGGALELLTPDQVQLLIIELHGLGFTCTRIDLAYDDFDRLIAPHHIWSEVVEWSGRDTCRLHLRGFRRVGQKTEVKGSRAYDEIYFGRRGQLGSGKYLRIYDKALESHGEINCIRYEIELTGDKARLAFSRLEEAIYRRACGESVTVAEAMGKIIGGAVDFIHKTDKNLDRGKRFCWWAKIMEHLGSDLLCVKHPNTAVERSRDWLNQQCVRTFKMVAEAMGQELFLDQFVKLMGSTRLRKQHEAAIAAYRARLVETGQNPDFIELRQAFTDLDIDIDSDEDNPEDVAENQQGFLFPAFGI